MTVLVHPLVEEEWTQKGYVRVETWRNTSPRILMADPERTCLRKLRDGHCTMDKDHRGRCSTVTFVCDGCGKTRRGTPDVQDEDIALCFMCYGKPFRDSYYGRPEYQ